MSLEAALIRIFTEDPAVYEAVGEKIFPLSVENPRVPYVLYEVTGGADDFTRSGYSGLEERRVTITCVARRYVDAVALARVIKAALPLWGMTVTTIPQVQIRMIRRDEERDYFSASAGKSTPVARQIDFTFKYSLSD
jgi:hypothetical protein